MYNIHIIVHYEWDDTKDEVNQRKHKIPFELAKSVFSDPYAIAELDISHSQIETRLKLVGKCSDNRILTVIFTKRGSTIRIISAQERRRERKVYESQI